MEISFIIVSWNACKYLEQCLESVERESSGLEIEIIVVDNASTDGSPEMVQKKYPKVSLIKQTENLGFAKANNLGLSESKGDFLFLINSDIIVKKDCIKRLLAFLKDNPDVGIAGPRILYPDGTFQRSCMKFVNLWSSFCIAIGLSSIFPKSRIFGGFEMGWIKWDQTCNVDIVNGCFWAIRRTAFEQVGGLDERFFMYGEDMDWCKRFSDAGWKRVFFNDAESIHFGGASSSNKPIRFYIEMIKANLQYWKKHHGNLQAFICSILYTIHCAIRILGYSTLFLLDKNIREVSFFKVKKNLAVLSFLFTKTNAF